MYELMDRIGEIMVRSLRPAAREVAGDIFLRFLIYYPMGDKRFQHHMQVAVRNLDYVHTAGRLSALELLSTMMQRLPPPILDAHAEVLFLPTVLRLANDEDAACEAQRPTSKFVVS